MYDVVPAREHDAWACGTAVRHESDGEVWHTNQAAAFEYRADDADRREAEARQKPVLPRKGDPFDAPNGGSARPLGRKAEDDHGYHRLDWEGTHDAGLGIAYLPEHLGGKGRTNPMDAVAANDRQRGFRAYYGDDRAAAYIDTKRTMSDGTRFVVPVGASVWRRPLRGKLSYLKKFSDPTGNEAVRNAMGAPESGEFVLYMTRERLTMWLEIHKVLVARGKLTDNGRTAVLESMIAGIRPKSVASLRLYSRADFRQFRHVPKRFLKGALADYIRFVSAL